MRPDQIAPNLDAVLAFLEKTQGGGPAQTAHTLIADLGGDKAVELLSDAASPATNGGATANWIDTVLQTAKRLIQAASAAEIAGAFAPPPREEIAAAWAARGSQSRPWRGYGADV